MSSPATTGEHASPKRLEIPQALRALVRARESGLVVVAALVGAMSGAIVAAMGHAVSAMHHQLFGVALDQRLSANLQIDPLAALLVPAIGGALLGFALWILVRVRPGRIRTRTHNAKPSNAPPIDGTSRAASGSICKLADIR